MSSPSKTRPATVGMQDADDAQRQLYVDILKGIVTDLAKQEAAKNHDGDATKIPEVRKRELMVEAKQTALYRLRSEHQLLLDNGRFEAQAEQSQSPRSTPRPRSKIQPKIQSKLYQAWPSQLLSTGPTNSSELHSQRLQNNSQSGFTSSPSIPVKSESTSSQNVEQPLHDDSVTIAQRQAELYTNLPSPPDDCKYEVQTWQNNLTSSIVVLNKLHREFKLISASAARYPFQQRVVLDHMTKILSIRSGLTNLVKALMSPEKLVELYNACKTATAKMESLLPNIKQIVTWSLALIADATTRHTMISQTYTTFYNQFSALKARLVVEDIGRGLSQEKFGTVLKQSRLEVWRSLEPSGDEELHQGIEKWDITAATANYGSGYAVATGGTFYPSSVGSHIEHNK